MSDEHLSSTQSRTDVSEWLKTAQVIWESILTRNPSESIDPAPEPSANKNPSANGAEQSRAFQEQAWQTENDQKVDPQNLGTMIQGLQMLPEYSAKLIQFSLEGMTQVQDQWSKHLNTLQGPLETPRTDKEFSNEFIDQWTRWYDTGFRQLFNLPQLGLTRYYQENINQALDKYNQLQLKLTEFLHLLYQPIEKSFQQLQGEWSETNDLESFPKEYKAYYAKWVATLEGCYMTLFQTPEYVLCLHKTVQSLGDFIQARQTVMEDALKFLPIPTNSDLDELYKEIHRLKKQVRALEKGAVFAKPFYSEPTNLT